MRLIQERCHRPSSKVLMVRDTRYHDSMYCRILCKDAAEARRCIGCYRINTHQTICIRTMEIYGRVSFQDSFRAPPPSNFHPNHSRVQMRLCLYGRVTERQRRTSLYSTILYLLERSSRGKSLHLLPKGFHARNKFSQHETERKRPVCKW